MDTKIFKSTSIVFMLYTFFGFIFSLPELGFPWSLWFILFSFITVTFFREVRVGVFILFIIWGYSFAGNIIPQQEFKKKSIKDVKRSTELFIRAGREIFNGKGMCYLCHSIGPSRKARCPDLLKASKEASMRKAGYTAKEYFIESLYKPDAYIVQGYSNIMPPIWKPPISLTPLEIETVIAYVQSLSGDKVDLTPFVPPVDIGVKDGEKKSDQEVLTGDPIRGKEIFESGKGKCLACHKVLGKGGEGEDGKGDTIGPDLSEIAKINTINYIKESILSPNMKITTGYAFVDFRTKEDLRVEGKIIKEDSASIIVLSEEDKIERGFKKSDIEVRDKEVEDSTATV
jgi:putative heme-binding domain-containing protein